MTGHPTEWHRDVRAVRAVALQPEVKDSLCPGLGTLTSTESFRVEPVYTEPKINPPDPEKGRDFSSMTKNQFLTKPVVQGASSQVQSDISFFQNCGVKFKSTTEISMGVQKRERYQQAGLGEKDS